MRPRLMSLALALLLAAVAVFGSAAAMSDSEPLPDSLDLRPAHEDDKFRFNYTNGEFHHDASYGILPPREMHNVHGLLRPAYVLQERELRDGRLDSEGNPVPATYEDLFLGFDTESQVGLREMASEEAATSTGFFRDVPVPCMMAPAMNGGIQGVPERINFGTCSLSDIGFAHLVLHRRGAVQAGGTTYVHYHGDALATAGVGTMDAWFAPGAPGPVKLVYERDGELRGGRIGAYFEALGEEPRSYGIGEHLQLVFSGTVHARLTGYTPGSGPALEAPVAPTAGHAPPLETAPPEPYGIPEATVTDAWTPRAAYEVLMAHEDGAATRALLAAGAMAMEVRHSSSGCVEGYCDASSETVTFEFATQDERITTEVIRRTDRTQPVPLPPGFLEPETTVSFLVNERATEWAWFHKGPEDLPPEFPTHESLIGRGNVLLGTDALDEVRLRWSGLEGSDPLIPFGVSGRVHTVQSNGPLEPETVSTTHFGMTYDADLLISKTTGVTWTWETTSLVDEVIDAVVHLTSGSEPEPVPTYWEAPGPVGWASASALGIAVGAVAFVILSKLFGVGLFSRLKTPEVLHHPVRKQIMDTIAKRPGIHYKELMRMTGKGRGTLTHHLDTLSRHGQIRSVVAPGSTCYFLIAQVDNAVAEASPFARNATARKILKQAIRERPSTADMVVALGVSMGTLSYHAKRLEAAGLLERERDGRSYVFCTTPLGRDVLANIGAA